MYSHFTVRKQPQRGCMQTVKSRTPYFYCQLKNQRISGMEKTHNYKSRKIETEGDTDSECRKLLMALVTA